jgi:endonuclease I
MFFYLFYTIFQISLFSNINISYVENQVLPQEIKINQKVDFSLIITNNFSNNITVDKIVISGIDSDSLKLDIQTPVSLGVDESKIINFSLQINNNITYNFLLDFNLSIKNSKFSEYFLVKTEGIVSDYYKSTQNLYGDILIEELKNVISEHTVHTYRNARIFMWEDLHNINGTVECIYTGQTIQHTTGIPNVQQTRFNTEHTWPQSLGSNSEPPLSDLHHIFPSNEIANARRANYPFDYVTNSIIWQEGGSTLGKNDKGETIFEVRDVHKGNTARAILYFALKYGNNSNYLNSQEKVLKEWSYNDLPDEFELQRNEKAFQFQHNRNPFIDNPHFLDRIGSLAHGGFPELINNISIRQNKITLELDIIDNFNLNIFNSGSSNLAISNIILPEFLKEINFSNTTLSRGDLISYNLEFDNNFTNDNLKGDIIITYNNNEHHLIEIEVFKFSSIKNKSNLFISPNPTNNFIEIENGFFEIKCFDLFGREININSNSNILDTSKLTPGIYFLNIKYLDGIKSGQFVKI